MRINDGQWGQTTQTGREDTKKKKKNGPRDVNNISWAVLGQFFFQILSFFFSFVTNICFIGVITTSMTATAHRNTTGVNNKHRQPPTPRHSCSHHYHPQGLPISTHLGIGFIKMLCLSAMISFLVSLPPLIKPS